MMRCLIRLKATKDQVYEPAYHVKLQGVVYDLLEESGYGDIHDEAPFKFVTFSNVFPPRDMQEGDGRTLIISSPNDEVMKSVQKEVNSRELIEPGDRQYEVEDTAIFNISPERQGTMITGTPIVVRIPASRCDEYGIDDMGYDDVYWRLEHNSDAFIDKVEENLASKYREYYDREPPERPYFTGYHPRKQVSVPLKYEDKEVPVIGTTWELDYECENREMHRIIRMAYDAGLGELNTTGFGFMNEVEN